MSLTELKQEVFQANLDLVKHGLVIFTWGNVSGIDREKGLVAIKPSGVPYETMKAEDMVILDLEGNVVEGTLRPSSDTPTHLELYREFLNIGSVSHTHSAFAASWAQAGRDIPITGTTQADYFSGDIPCTRDMTQEEIEGEFELNTGKVIVDTFKQRDINPDHIPGVLVKNHAPFAWGKDCDDCVHNSVVLEQVAKMGVYAHMLNPDISMNPHLVKKHFNRKHGPGAYYGQK